MLDISLVEKFSTIKHLNNPGAIHFPIIPLKEMPNLGTKTFLPKCDVFQLSQIIMVILDGDKT